MHTHTKSLVTAIITPILTVIAFFILAIAYKLNMISSADWMISQAFINGFIWAVIIWLAWLLCSLAITIKRKNEAS